MKIYVITKGVYSDYHIITATTDKALAEKLKQKYTYEWGDRPNIEEYDDAESKVKNCYIVTFHINGEYEVRETNGEYEDIDEVPHENVRGAIVCSVFADDVKQAIKIASERYARYLYEKSEGMHDNNLKGE